MRKFMAFSFCFAKPLKPPSTALIRSSLPSSFRVPPSRTMSSTTNSTNPPTRRPSNPSIGWQLLAQKPLADPTTPFTGKTILITGANSGLGLAAATKFAALNPSRLILAVRNLDSGRAAQRALQEQLEKTTIHSSQSSGTAGTGHANDNATVETKIELWHLDMDSYASIAAFAQRATDELDRLNVAVLNAGVYEVAYGVSAYGWERTLQVNTLSTALLAVLLLPKLRASAAKRNGGGVGGDGGGPSVLEVVASRRAEAVQLTKEQREGSANVLGPANAVGQGGYKPSEQYRLSKLLMLGMVKELAALVDASEVTVTAVCPGGVATNLSRGWTGVVAGVVKALVNTLIMRTPEYAARSVVSGASLGREASGKLWYDDDLHELTSLAGEDGQKLADKIWAEVTDALRREVPAVGDVLKALPGQQTR
ncbi:hypothetical protein VTI74DRAFT_5017 [Chaetomium olivicolor]